MWIILQLLFLLSPEQKSLVAMARQGDMIAADQLASEVCAMPGEARQKAASQIRKRVKGKKSKAIEMLTTGLDRCAPVGQGTAVQAVKVQPSTSSDAPRRRGLTGRMVMIPGSQSAADKGKSSAPQGRRRPISSENNTSGLAKAHEKSKTSDVASVKKSGAEKSSEKQKLKRSAIEKKQSPKKDVVKKTSSTIVRRSAKNTSTKNAVANKRHSSRTTKRTKNVASLDSLPDGDVDSPADGGTRGKLGGRRDDTAEQNLPALESLDSQLVSSETQPRPSRLADVERDEKLTQAMTFYGLGGGFVAVATVSYVGAVMALGSGAFQQMQLKAPEADSSLQTPDGRSEQDVYDVQVTAIWTSAGILSAIAAVTATAELIAGFVLFSQGDSSIEGEN